MSEKKEWFCSRCDAPGASILCLQCRDAAWCSAECQKKDWLEHKGFCRERVKTVAEKRGWDVPATPERPAAEEVTADSTWHAVPEPGFIWRLRERGGEPECIEVARDDARWRAVAGDGTQPRVQGRVSVVVATLHERYRFHPQLWLCFYAQTYADKELIVVDSGEGPSPFFKGKQGPDFKYVFVNENLSVGEKRNLAIREYSTGEIILNFDDDDLYFPAYVQTAVKLLKSSKAALVHLNAWSVVDIEENFCGFFDRSQPLPSEAEAMAWGELCGFSMAYTYAAWRCITWPPLTSGEDRHFLRCVAAAGMPVAARAEAARGTTVLHLQHGKNIGRSLCQKARTDTAAVTNLIQRFEEACRRIIKLPQSEYDQLGGSLLYQGLHNLSLAAEPPKAARGLFLAVSEDSREDFQSWLESEVGQHPQREVLVGQQLDRLRSQAADEN